MLSHGWSRSEIGSPRLQRIAAKPGDHPDDDRRAGRPGPQPKFRNPAMLVVGRVAGPPRAPALVRRPPAVRQAHRRHPAARAGRGPGRSAGPARGDGHRGANGADRRRRRISRRSTRPAPPSAGTTGSLFTSPNGVDYFFQRMQLGPTDTRSLAGVKLCAIGPGTAERLGAALPAGRT